MQLAIAICSISEELEIRSLPPWINIFMEVVKYLEQFFTLLVVSEILVYNT